MAKVYKATTPIKFGAPDGTVMDFAVADVVEGLSNEQMAALWEAGALEAAEVTAESSGDASTEPTTGGDTDGGTGNA